MPFITVGSKTAVNRREKRFHMEVISPTEPEFDLEGKAEGYLYVVDRDDIGDGSGNHLWDVYSYDTLLGTGEASVKFKDVSSTADVVKVIVKRTDFITDFSYMFASGFNYSMSNLTEVIFEDTCNTSNVTNMSRMFYSCPNLITITGLSNLNTSNVTTMDFLFAYCYDLTSIDISTWDTSNVTVLNNAFNYCNSLSSLDLSNWGTSSVTDMHNMFHHCESLTSLDVTNFDTSNVTDMNGMFYKCSDLECLNLLDTTNATDTTDMFYDCGNLTAPDATAQSNLLNGASWTNPNSCP